MGKIALFTCHRDPNYGSMLQAYALAAAIRKLGKEAEYMDYYTSPEPPTGLGKIVRDIRHIVATPLRWYRRFKKRNQPKSEFYFFGESWFQSTLEAYKRFHNQYIPTSSKKYYANTVRQKLDVDEYENYIVGSDQTWSPNLYSPKNPYFFDFADIKRKNAYAPSLGTTVISEEYMQLMKEKLSSFEHLSCREKTNCETLTNALGREVSYVLDPTLLLDANDWNKVAKDPDVKGHYILAYILGEKDKVIEFAERLGEEKHLPVYYVVTRPKYRNKPHALIGLGPDDFIGYIKHADYMVTDSFHGCLFCINYEINFYAFSKREGNLNSIDNIRIQEFLNMAGLLSRFQDENTAKMLDNICFENCSKYIIKARNMSINYLKLCLH